jgi:hypothetical protein
MKAYNLLLFALLIIPGFLYAQREAYEIIPGAKAFWINSGTIRCIDISTGEFSTVGEGSGTVKVSGNGKYVVAGNHGSGVVVYELATGTQVYSKSITFNGSGDASDAVEISWDGSEIMIVQGDDINALNAKNGSTRLLFATTSSNRIREGELSASWDWSRIVGRYSNNKAIYIDVAQKTQGQYANECSPCISPSGRITAVNQNGHTTMQIYKWDEGAGSPQKWKKCATQVGEWDNHTWSNHENYLIGTGKILDVNSCESFLANAGGSYNDLWVPVGPPDTIPPSVPSQLSLIEAGPTSVTLSCDPATDNNNAVIWYMLYDAEGTMLSRTVNDGATVRFSGLTPQKSWTLSMRASDGYNESESSNTISATTTSSRPAPLPCRINVGSTDTVAGFLPDKPWAEAGDFGYTIIGFCNTTSSDMGSEGDTALVYRSLRYGPRLEYKIYMGGGSYTVRLLFADFWRDPGTRVFQVDINGQTQQVDPAKIAGGRGKAGSIRQPVDVSDGFITIAFNSISDQEPICNGIEITGNRTGVASAGPMKNISRDNGRSCKINALGHRHSADWLRVLDLSGRVVLSRKVHAGKSSVPFYKLVPGRYTVVYLRGKTVLSKEYYTIEP